MTTNVSSGPTKYKLLLTAFEDEDKGELGTDRGALEKTEGNWGRQSGTGEQREAWQGARGFDRDGGTQRVLAKTPQN